MSIRDNVFADILAELQRQEALWGEQNHPDHVPNQGRLGVQAFADQATHWKNRNKHRADRGETAWDGILLEEVFEACEENDPAKLRIELIQVAAVAANWLECLVRRESEACPYTRHWCGRPTCRES